MRALFFSVCVAMFIAYVLLTTYLLELSPSHRLHTDTVNFFSWWWSNRPTRYDTVGREVREKKRKEKKVVTHAFPFTLLTHFLPTYFSAVPWDMSSLFTSPIIKLNLHIAKHNLSGHVCVFLCFFSFHSS